ncbi:hypothetical protein T265_12186, partial [Opisthorchis viverrini]
AFSTGSQAVQVTVIRWPSVSRDCEIPEAIYRYLENQVSRAVLRRSRWPIAETATPRTYLTRDWSEGGRAGQSGTREATWIGSQAIHGL